jgi:hypothetical protein
MLGGVVEIPVRSLRNQGNLRVIMRRKDFPKYTRSYAFTPSDPDIQVVRVSMDDWIQPTRADACYNFDLEFILSDGITIGAPRLMIDIQCAPVALPGLDLESSSTVAVRFQDPGGKARLRIEHRITPDAHLVATHIPAVANPLPETGAWQFWNRPIQIPLDALAPGRSTAPWVAAWEQLLCEVDTEEVWQRTGCFAAFVNELSRFVAYCQGKDWAGNPFLIWDPQETVATAPLSDSTPPNK